MARVFRPMTPEQLAAIKAEQRRSAEDTVRRTLARARELEARGDTESARDYREMAASVAAGYAPPIAMNPQMKLSDMGTTGLMEYVVSAPAGRRWALRLGQAIAVIKRRYGPEGVRRFKLAVKAALDRRNPRTQYANPRWSAARVARSIGSRYVPPKYRLAALARRSKVNPYTGSSRDRDKLRRWQDVLIKRAQSQGLNDDARLSVDDPGSPTLRDMRQYIFPAYYDIIERMANERQNPVAPKAFARIMDLEAQRAAASSDPERYYAIQREQDEYEDRYGWPYRASGEQLAYWREWKRGQRNPAFHMTRTNPGLAQRIKPDRVVVRRVPESDEWAVYGYKGNRRVTEYFTNDRADAEGTARIERARAGINPIVTDTDLLGRQHARLAGPSGKGRTTGALFGTAHQLTAKEKQEQEELLAWRAKREKERAEGQMDLFANPPRGRRNPGPWYVEWKPRNGRGETFASNLSQAEARRIRDQQKRQQARDGSFAMAEGEWHMGRDASHNPRRRHGSWPRVRYTKLPRYALAQAKREYKARERAAMMSGDTYMASYYRRLRHVGRGPHPGYMKHTEWGPVGGRRNPGTRYIPSWLRRHYKTRTFAITTTRGADFTGKAKVFRDVRSPTGMFALIPWGGRGKKANFTVPFSFEAGDWRAMAIPANVKKRRYTVSHGYNPRKRRTHKRKCLRICRWRNKRGKFVKKGRKR